VSSLIKHPNPYVVNLVKSFLMKLWPQSDKTVIWSTEAK
jgi:hypothetical protein